MKGWATFGCFADLVLDSVRGTFGQEHLNHLCLVKQQAWCKGVPELVRVVQVDFLYQLIWSRDEWQHARSGQHQLKTGSRTGQAGGQKHGKIRTHRLDRREVA